LVSILDQEGSYDHDAQHRQTVSLKPAEIRIEQMDEAVTEIVSDPRCDHPKNKR